MPVRGRRNNSTPMMAMMAIASSSVLLFPALPVRPFVLFADHRRRRRRGGGGGARIRTRSEPADSDFGRREYWDGVYRTEANFSWYAGWDELAPFCEAFFDKDRDRILIPGVGNDASLVGMHDAGFTRLTAMDYAPEGIERCREMLGPGRMRRPSRRRDGGDDDEEEEEEEGVKLVVADARNDLGGALGHDSFDGILEKGTLDAIFLSGGDDKELAAENLDSAIGELSKCLRPGGTFVSIAAVAVGRIRAAFGGRDGWECLVDGDGVYMTEDGFTSNNIDGTMLVWRKRTADEISSAKSKKQNDD